MISKLFTPALLYFVIAIAMAFSYPANGNSGVVTGYGGTSQCYILLDSLPGTPGCAYRASVACAFGRSAAVGGMVSYGRPLTYPVVIDLYQRPSTTSIGKLTIPELPTVAGQYVYIGLNGTVSPWVLSAPFFGQVCVLPDGSK